MSKKCQREHKKKARECQGIQREPERAIKCQESAKECPWVKTRA